MDTVHEVVVIVSIVISAIGGLIVVWGVLEAAGGFLRMKLAGGGVDPMGASELIRQRLGAHLLLGLEVFIGGDIVSSVVSPSWDKVGLLAAIVAIRTVLSYFLRMEVKQTGRASGRPPDRGATEPGPSSRESTASALAANAGLVKSVSLPSLKD